MIKIRFVMLFILFLCANNDLLAQKKIDIDVSNMSINKILQTIASEYKISFFYSNDLKDLKKKVSLHLNQVAIEKAMYELLKGTNLVFKFVNQQILIKKKTEVDLSDKEWKIPESKPAPKKQAKIESGSQFVRVSGYVRDIATGEEMVGAMITSLSNQNTILTNSYGYYSMLIGKGAQQLKVTNVGYHSDTIHTIFETDTILNFTLSNTSIVLQQIIVTSSETASLMNDIASKKELEIEKKLSKGSISSDDIIDNIKLQSGIQTKNEGSTGYSVRGGGLDQNLILIDGAPVYNESHFLSLLSI